MVPSYDFEWDIAAIVLYLMIVLLYFHKPHVKDKIHRIYLALFTCATLSPVFDVISSVAIMKQWPGWIVMSTSTIYYLAIQGITYFFLLYITTQLEQYQRINRGLKHLLKVPVIVITLILLANDYTHWIFGYSNDRIYYLGPLQWVTYAVASFYFAWAVVYVNVHRNAYNPEFRFTIYNICVVNIVTMGLQFTLSAILDKTYLLICFGFAVSMVLLFLTAHTKNAAIDRETGLLNRFYLSETTTKMIYTKLPFNLILVRIADYSMLSGIYGMLRVERLVMEVGKQLGSLVEVGEAFQTNSSTFALIIRGEEGAEALENRIDELLSGERDIDGQKMSFSYLITSIGYPREAADVNALMSYLNYFEKMKKMRYGIIPTTELELRDTARESMVEKAIRRGLDEHNLHVYYQPMCTAGDRRFVTAEALVRLIDPELGFISPGEFIPVAEHSGLMIPVGNYVLEEVCRYISEHDMEALGLEYIEVNLSVVQCLQRDFMDIIHEMTSRYGIKGRYLCFEITETASNCAPEVFTENLRQLVAEGYALALDDFGSGYGNLQRMVTSEFKLVKFDKDMTQQTCASEQLRRAFKKMVDLFHSLELEVVAEGVETKEQYEYLASVHVDYIQGFYFSKPVCEEDFTAFINAHKEAD